MPTEAGMMGVSSSETSRAVGPIAEDGLNAPVIAHVPASRSNAWNQVIHRTARRSGGLSPWMQGRERSEGTHERTLLLVIQKCRHFAAGRREGRASAARKRPTCGSLDFFFSILFFRACERGDNGKREGDAQAATRVNMYFCARRARACSSKQLRILDAQSRPRSVGVTAVGLIRSVERLMVELTGSQAVNEKKGINCLVTRQEIRLGLLVRPSYGLYTCEGTENLVVHSRVGTCENQRERKGSIDAWEEETSSYHA
ncbi:hypothetical protein F5148DRAFT_335486 [Russula earlei]|uniref:Uncharacterized protein n=1 Tax=Russula earlei TaxID=71964 RepID=A0ACC0U2T1_9AGAM|nr:hypothetical protein F5148DRAFT_335486 [Russula earlei]